MIPHSSDLPPLSTSSFVVNLVSGIAFFAAIYAGVSIYHIHDSLQLAMIGMGCSCLVILVGEICFLRVHRRPRVGLCRPSVPDPDRVRIKLLGYYASLAFVSIIYAALPLYDSSFYVSFHFFYLLMLIPFIAGGWLYIDAFDNRLAQPYDRLWHFGAWLARRDGADRDQVLVYIKSLILRMFFTPLMFGGLVIAINMMIDGSGDSLKQAVGATRYLDTSVIFQIILLAYLFFQAVDALYATLGYLLVLRVMDTDIRSVEPRLSGWLVCLLCYSPFWDVLFASFLFKNFFSHPEWSVQLAGFSGLAVIWGSLAVLAMCCESLCTLNFGARFSNLTYRGVITSGPFRLTKHPQYISKLVNRFLVYMPFMIVTGVFDMVLTMAMFGGLCLIYFLRARTEENHLSKYPDYVQYAEWINRHGVLRFLTPVLPAWARYNPDRAITGRLF